MTQPSPGPFGRTLEDLFAVPPGTGRAPAVGAALAEVPDLAGKAAEAAGEALRDVRLLPRVLLVETTGAVGTVKRQEPPPGTFLRPGSQVTLYVVTKREPSDLERLTAALDGVRSEITAVKTEVGNVRTDLGNVKTEVGTVKTEVAALEREDVAGKRFEELRSLISGQGGKSPSGPKSS